MIRNKLQILSVALTMSVLSVNVFAQNTATHSSIQDVQYLIKVTTQILSSDEQEGLPYSSAVLINDLTGHQYGVNADENGHITWEAIPAGNYTLRAFYVGFDAYERKVIVPAQENNFEIPNVELIAGAARVLEEVKIVDFRDLIEDRPDGLVYNAEQDGTNVGTTADELLRKVPMVTVDFEGNVSLRGSQNIKVLIDNKPSTILAQSVSDALKQIPSDQIKSVEVITSPGAKYDGEGTSGVINIITKKNVITGFNGMVFGGANHTFGYDEVNGNVGTYLNFRRDKLGVTANLGLGRWSRHADGFSERTDFLEEGYEEKMRQEYNSKMGGPFLWGGLNFDYQIDSLQTVFAGFNISPGNYTNENTSYTSFPSRNIDYTRTIKDETPRMNYSFNASYNKIFKNNPKRHLDILGLYTIGSSNNKYNLSQIESNETQPNYWEKNINDATNNELTLQVDYTHPLKNDKQTIEVGAKYIHRDVKSDFHLDYRSGVETNPWQIDPLRTNALDYIQQVGSVYAQFTTPIVKKIDAILGVRAEYTDIEAIQRDRGGAFDDEYINLLPNAIITYDLGNFNRLKVSYFQRIGRPSISYINPYVNYSDEFNLQQGNPSLKPELSHNIELGYSGIFGRSSLNLSGFYRFTNNAIELVGTVENGVGLSTYGNFAENSTLGLNMNFSSRFFNIWMINLNADLYHKNIKSQSMNLENSGLEYQMNMYSSVQLGKGWSVEGFGMYNARSVMLQGTNSGYYFYMLGMKKTVLKGMGEIKLSASNIFHPKVKFTMENNLTNAHYYNESVNYARGVQVGFSYRFGKMTFSPRAKSIQNDDLLNGGGNQGGEQGKMMN